jgi:hypothetical protein
VTPEWLEEPTTNCVTYNLPGHMADPAKFTELARNGVRYMKRHLFVSRANGGMLVPRWARLLSEACCCAYVDPVPLLVQAQYDPSFRAAVYAAALLGGSKGLRDFAAAQGAST